jgi:hypothetical protein
LTAGRIESENEIHDPPGRPGSEPRLLEAHRRAYSRASHLGGRYRERVEATVRRLRLKHGFAGGGGAETGAYARPEQLDLFSGCPQTRRRASFGYRLLG